MRFFLGAVFLNYVPAVINSFHTVVHFPLVFARRLAFLRKRLSILVLLTFCFASLGMTTLAMAGSTSYSYDVLGRVTKVIYNNGTSTTTINYSYDAAGNRTTVVTTSP